jgi:hypothetical protein
MKRGLGPVLETQTQYSPLSAPQDGLNVTKTKKSVKKHTSSKIPEKKFWGSQMTRGSKQNRQSQ